MKVDQFRQHLLVDIAEAKETQNISSEAISEKTATLGEYVSPSTVYRVISGSNAKGVKLDTILAVADALGISYDKDEADEVLQLEVEHLHKSLVNAYERIASQDSQIANMRSLVNKLNGRDGRLSVFLCIDMALSGLTIATFFILLITGRLHIASKKLL